MQGVIDIIDRVFGGIRFIIGLFVLCMFGLVLFLTAGVSYVAPQVADNVADRAERVSNRAIEAAEEAHRNERLADEGWGYGADDGSSNGESDDWGAE